MRGIFVPRPTMTTMARLAPTTSYHAMPCLALPCLAMPCLALPCHALPCLAMPCHALPCLALPCHAMPCLALPCLALPCLAMPTMPCHGPTMPCHAYHAYHAYHGPPCLPCLPPGLIPGICTPGHQPAPAPHHAGFFCTTLRFNRPGLLSGRYPYPSPPGRLQGIANAANDDCATTLPSLCYHQNNPPGA